MNKTTNEDLVNVIFGLLKELELAINLSKPLTLQDRARIKFLLIKNNLEINSRKLRKIVDLL